MWLGGLLLLLATSAQAGGIAFPAAGCRFGFWPENSWRVAPPPPASPGRQLLRASHEPRRKLAIEAWVETPRSQGDEAQTLEALHRQLAQRGWTVDRVGRTQVGALPALRARAHRRTRAGVFVMEETWLDTGGRRYLLRATSRGVGGLQDPAIRRWQDSFRPST